MLTVKQIEAAKPKEKPYRLLDGNGLYLYVPVSGKKVWQLRYKIDGKEKILTVGKYPLMTLQEARDKAWIARKDISVGIDPVKAKKASSNNNSFSAIYKEWYEHKKQVWSVGYANELAKMFDDDILPIIGGLEIQDIEPMQLLEVIRRFEIAAQWSEPTKHAEDVARFSVTLLLLVGLNITRHLTLQTP